jgi:hypothetical protein
VWKAEGERRKAGGGKEGSTPHFVGGHWRFNEFAFDLFRVYLKII